MPTESDSLRQHYSSLSDEALLELDRDDLNPLAQKCYDEELRLRGLEHNSSAPAPDWMEDAACASTFVLYPGGDAADNAEQARSFLQNAGIPCYVDAREGGPNSPREYCVMVPGKLTLPAMSVLDAEIFNLDVEAEWRQYFETLTDEELHAVDTTALFRGLQDRLERVRRAYEEEKFHRSQAAPDAQ